MNLKEILLAKRIHNLGNADRRLVPLPSNKQAWPSTYSAIKLTGTIKNIDAILEMLRPKFAIIPTSYFKEDTTRHCLEPAYLGYYCLVPR